MAKVSTNISLDPEVKKAGQELFADLGMDLSTAVTIFIKQCLKTQGIPFEISREVPNTETIEALRETEDIINNPQNYKQYDNIRELAKEVLGDV